MKKILLGLCTLIATSVTTFAQDGVVIKVAKVGGVATGDDVDYSSGHAPYVVNSTNINDNVIDLDIENHTGASVSWRVVRYKAGDVPSDWTNMVCAGGMCFPNSANNPYCTPAQFPIELANGEVSETPFHVNPESEGTGTFTLYVGPDCDNPVDSITIVLNYGAGSVKELKQTPSFSMYPNPTDDFVSVQVNNIENGKVKVVDLLGNVVYSEAIGTISKINVSDFKNGVYFVTIESEGNKIASKKLVIRH